MFESVLNRSDVSGGIAHAALLAKLKDDIYLLFYTEFDQDQQPRVRCLLLDLSRLKIDEVLKRRNDVEGTCFIDEPTKEDLMDSLLQQRLDNFNSLSARRQVQLTVEKQQMKLQAIRHKFRMLITDEVKQRMWDKPKKVQSEVADMCLKGMNFRFKGIHSMTKAEETDVKLWLSSFLDLLGVKAN
ncbi:uncharacterized protein CYBJADRAFT_7949 [Cyberlindnera jadinii NRRL Y-1542]|uniref:Uncharacterized protein n=1 Tax=Cyberlindnera jadinii (strain ATCC 18201 / CBS 1600 / BCRC 20928 / JCM 3617 / NBRC 0987 / NRRL Y-1542) TaxID=983966 RepID=A0A1E4S9K6_CYBJN|nr:hypothetical protein CYBJADRAFT_7949 [Cyberlindnera jadinii NRRL Y-1542]ODV76173.1 hypothetical protein CYBJADRAFT_7949 [Cyberlindnera jadinii NRRL Y-1542]